MPRYLGQGLAEKLSDLAGLPAEEREVAAYGLEYLLSAVTGLALMLLLGLALGLLLEALVIILCWVPLRVFAGGGHCTALWRCNAFSCLGMLAALLLTLVGASLLMPAPAWAGAAILWTLLAVALWAPNNSERPVVHDPSRRERLRARALILTATMGSSLLYFAVTGHEQGQALSVAGATGMAFGGFMISPAALRLVRSFDNCLGRLKVDERR